MIKKCKLKYIWCINIKIVSEQIEKVENIGTKHIKNSYALDRANEHGEIFMN